MAGLARVRSTHLGHSHLRWVEVPHRLHGHIVSIQTILHETRATGRGRHRRGIDAHFALYAGNHLFPPIAQAIGNRHDAGRQGDVLTRLPRWIASPVPSLMVVGCNIGGKSNIAWQGVVPVIFELGVLCAAFATLGGLFVRSRLRPRLATAVPESQPGPRVGDDRFVLVVAERDASFDRHRFSAACRALDP